MTMMAVATINSIRVNPCCWRPTTDFFLHGFIDWFIKQFSFLRFQFSVKNRSRFSLRTENRELRTAY
jgi:hypothetical protein